MKPGIKTTEFWITLAVTALGGVMSMLPSESIWTKVIGGALALAGSLGYGVMRAGIKKADSASKPK